MTSRVVQGNPAFAASKDWRSVMGSYEEVLVDVVRYKYLCDEGFLMPPPSQARLRCQEDGYFQHLVQCIATDTGMDRAVAERGLIHAALQRGRLDSAFFEAVVTALYA